MLYYGINFIEKVFKSININKSTDNRHKVNYIVGQFFFLYENPGCQYFAPNDKDLQLH